MKKCATTFSIMTLSIMTFSIMTFSIMTFSLTKFSIMTFSKTAFSIMTFSIMTVTLKRKGFFGTLSINDIQHKRHSAYSVSSAIMLSVAI